MLPMRLRSLWETGRRRWFDDRLIDAPSGTCCYASRIIAVDLNEKRLQVAKQLGATETIRETSAMRQAIMDLTMGAPCGIEVSAPQFVRSNAEGGNVTGRCLSRHRPAAVVVTREISLHGTCGCNGDILSVSI